jgi:polyisoprenoid-binding protein YceI
MSSPATLTGTYVIEPTNSRIGFVARSALVARVRGSFDDFSGSGYFDAEDPTRSHLEMRIDAKSINTHNARRDAHLRSDDYFAVEEHRAISFVSTAVERIDHEHHRVIGDLLIKGIRRPVIVDIHLTGASDPVNGDDRIKLEGRAKVNRKQWGVQWNAVLEGGGVFVGNNVAIELQLSAARTGEVA